MLDVKDLRVRYGTVEAVKGISFRVTDGAIISLIGANGAGKTTSLRAITGLVKPSGGDLRFEDRSLVGLAPHEIVRLGIAHVPEGRRLFPKMTVLENLKMGAYLRTNRAEKASTLAMIYQHLPILRERGHQLAGSLSGGEQQMLAIAVASAPGRPVSESGRLRYGDGAHGRGGRRRMLLMSPSLPHGGDGTPAGRAVAGAARS